MTHDDDKEALFLQFWPGLGCLIVFPILIVFVALPKAFYQFFMYHIKHGLGYENPEHRADFIYQFWKALDCALGAGLLGCLHDETISNKAGQHVKAFKENNTPCPRWAMELHRRIDKLEKDHVLTSIEYCRPKPIHKKPTRAKK